MLHVKYICAPKMCQNLNLAILINVYLLEVIDHGSEIQLQVGKL